MLKAREFVCKILETNDLVVNHCYDWTYFRDFSHLMSREEHNPEAGGFCSDSSSIIRQVSRVWPSDLAFWPFWPSAGRLLSDRKSTRLNSSHLGISYAVFCLKKKNS